MFTKEVTKKQGAGGPKGAGHGFLGLWENTMTGPLELGSLVSAESAIVRLSHDW